jgi:hypothetical protein
MKTKLTALILAAALTLALAGCANEPETGNWQGQGNTPGNIINWGDVTISGDWIYYRNQTSNNNLYKVKIDGTSKKRLNTDTTFFINVVGDWIFYVNYDDDKIYRIDINGNNKEAIIEKYVRKLFVVNGEIYFVSGSAVLEFELHRINIHSNQGMHIEEAGQCIQMIIVEDWIYYHTFSENGIYKIRPDGIENTRLSDNKVRIVNVIDDWIYYVNVDDNNYIYRMRTDSSDNELVVSNSVEHVNIYEDWIFYVNLDDNETIYRIKTNGTEKEKLNDDESYHINIIDGWIYYTKWNTRRWSDAIRENEIYRMRFDGSEHERVT